MSRCSRSIVAAALFVSFIVASARAAFEFQPGQWQETETGTEDGKPAKPEVTQSCMTPEEAKDPVKSLQLDKDMKGQCKTLDVKQSGNGMAIRMVCGDPKQFAADIDAQFVFVSATRYTGTMKSSVTFGGKTTTTDKKIEAVRIGECKPGSSKPGAGK